MQYNIDSIDGFDLEFNPDGSLRTSLQRGDGDGEFVEGAETFAALGLIGRPLPPDNRDGRDEHMEVVCVRQQDGLIPIAARDLRLRMGGNAPGDGVLAFAGYGGGFHSLTPVAAGGAPDGGGTLHVLYCPYDYDGNGVAQKAHSVILDPTGGNESVVVAHASGCAVTMTNDELVMKSPDGSSWIGLSNDGITIVGKSIQLSGGVIIGNAQTAVPLLAGAASPPCSTLLVSP